MGQLPSAKDTVVSDTTTSNTYEDVDGLSTSLQVDDDSDILLFASVQGSANGAGKAGWRLVFDSVNFLDLERQVGSEPGNICLVDRVVNKGAGTYTFKLQHKVDSGRILTTSNAIIVAVSLHNGSGAVPANSIYVASDTVGSGWEDIPGLSCDVTLSKTSHIWAMLVWNGYFSSSGKEAACLINIDATDMETHTRDFGAANEYGCVSVVTRTDAKKTAGVYTVKARWRGGAGTTLTGEDFTLVVIAGEADSGVADINITKDVVASDSTTATSIEDITGLSVTAAPAETAHILGVMCLDTDVNQNNRSAYTTISIDTIDYDVMERGHASKQVHGSIGQVVRTDSTKAAGSYTVNGRWYTDAATTLAGEQIVLTSIALAATLTTFKDTISGAARILGVIKDTASGLARIKGTGIKDTISGEARVKQVSIKDTISGLARILEQVKDVIGGTARILGTVKDTMDGLARIKGTGIKDTIAGYANIITVTTVKDTISGLARLLEEIKDTISGSARIKGVDIKDTISGAARVKLIEIKDIMEGLARILETGIKDTVSGVARIKEVNIKDTMAGLARVLEVVKDVISGTARIKGTDIKDTASGIARIKLLEIKDTISGFANIVTTAAVKTTISGLARIKGISIKDTISGLAKIIIRPKDTISGLARIEEVVKDVISGLARIKGVGIKDTVAGLARILGTVKDTVSGSARIKGTGIKDTVGGLARVKVANLKDTVSGLARVKGAVKDTMAGLARIFGEVRVTIGGLARIKLADIKSTVSGYANVVLGAVKRDTIGGYAFIEGNVDGTIEFSLLSPDGRQSIGSIIQWS